jgi:hypothetical protein
MYTKIKHTAGETTLEWQDSNAKESVSHSLNSHEDPRPEFKTALQALTAFVCGICELPLDYTDEMTISSVTLTDHDTLGRGCVVTALKKLSRAQSPLVLNTPHVTETPAADGQPALPGYAIDLLERLVDEAERYRKGERAQQDLFKAAA